MLYIIVNTIYQNNKDDLLVQKEKYFQKLLDKYINIYYKWNMKKQLSNE